LNEEAGADTQEMPEETEEVELGEARDLNKMATQNEVEREKALEADEAGEDVPTEGLVLHERRRWV
jgi:hypothetical protein